MRENKRLQIRRLKGEVDRYRTLEESRGPFVTIGEELHGRVMRRVQEMGEPDLERALVEEVTGSEERLVREGIWARITQLPPRTVLAWYAKVVGDEEVHGLLAERAEIEKEFLRSNMHVERMRQWGATYQNIDTSMTQLNDRMVVGLTWRTQSEYTGYSKDKINLRRLEREDAGGAMFEVLRPPRLDGSYGGLSVDSHAVLIIGGAGAPKAETLDPIVSLDTPLATLSFSADGNLEESPKNTRGTISYITINDILVLGELPVPVEPS